MSVTECCISTRKMDPEAARWFMEMRRRADGEGSTSVDQLRAIAGLCNFREFDAASSEVSLVERKVNGNVTDQAILRFSKALEPVSKLRSLWKKHF